MKVRVAVVCLALVTFVGATGAVGVGPGEAATPRWRVVPTAAGAAFGDLAAVSCPAAKMCVAVGTQNVGSKSVKMIQRWNGKKWIAQISPSPPGMKSSSLAAVRCPNTANRIAVGRYSTATATRTLALRWSNNRWSLMTTPNPVAAVSGLSGLACNGPTNCIAVGGYFVSTPFESKHLSLAEHWNGTKWSIVPTPNVANAYDSVLQSVGCATPTDCFAVGYSHTTLREDTLVQRWNGSTWSIIPSPNPTDSADNELAGIACSAPTQCTAVGTSDHGTLVERWNGTAWSIANSPNPVGATGAALGGVTCPATRCFAVGVWFKQAAQNVQKKLVEQLTPTRNTIVGGVPLPSDAKRSALHAISCANNTNCFAVGNYRRGPSARPLLIRYGP